MWDWSQLDWLMGGDPAPVLAPLGNRKSGLLGNRQCALQGALTGEFGWCEPV